MMDWCRPFFVVENDATWSSDNSATIPLWIFFKNKNTEQDVMDDSYDMLLSRLSAHFIIYYGTTCELVLVLYHKTASIMTASTNILYISTQSKNSEKSLQLAKALPLVKSWIHRLHEPTIIEQRQRRTPAMVSFHRSAMGMVLSAAILWPCLPYSTMDAGSDVSWLVHPPACPWRCYLFEIEGQCRHSGLKAQQFPSC